tara:strand:+ start:44 stop:457 length:414 start_codon:yes stop_codon:yes gene_type:complete
VQAKRDHRKVRNSGNRNARATERVLFSESLPNGAGGIIRAGCGGNQLLALLEQGAEAFGFRGQHWTGPRVAQLIRTHFGVTYHPRYIPSLLNQWGWTWQKPQKQASQRDESAIAQWHDQTVPAIKKSNPRKPHPRLH